MTKRIRVLIVDDESPARQRLRNLLRKEPDIEIAAEAANGPEALDALLLHEPELIFLDIQMPEMNGFELLHAMEAEGRELPLVIFVTAFDDHAVRAFEVHALDYLVKPVERERFSATLQRARTMLTGRKSEELERRMERIEQLLADRDSDTPRDSFVARKGERMIIVRSETIDWIESAGNYVTLHTANGDFLLRETMQSLERQLDPSKFTRIHRTAIVNVDRIQELSPSFHGDFFVTLIDGTQLTLSRTRRERVESMLGKF